MITEISDPSTAVQMMAMGAQDYISKSELSAESIRKAIIYAIERQQYLQELERYKNELERLVDQRTRQLEESRERYRILAAASPSGVFRTAADDLLIFVNEKWTEITGYREEEILGRCWWEFAHPDEQERCAQSWSIFIDDASIPAFSIEFRIVHQDGHSVWIQLQANKIDRFTHSGTVGLINDVTRTKGLVDQLRKLNERR